MSRDLLIMMSAVMPEEMLIEQLQEALTTYKLAPSEDNKHKVCIHAQLFITKVMQEHMKPHEMMTELDKISRIKDRMESEKQ